jgi:hypothetical protein
VDARAPGAPELDTHTADPDTRPAEPPSSLDAKRDRGGLPGWLKITLLMLAIVVLLVVSMMLLGGGHNPGRHL